MNEITWSPGENRFGENPDAAVVATIARFGGASRPQYVARVLIPGRPILVLRPAPSHRAAMLNLLSRWPEARFVDDETFARFERHSTRHTDERPEVFDAEENPRGGVG